MARVKLTKKKVIDKIRMLIEGLKTLEAMMKTLAFTLGKLGNHNRLQEPWLQLKTMLRINWQEERRGGNGRIRRPIKRPYLYTK